MSFSSMFPPLSWISCKVRFHRPSVCYKFLNEISNQILFVFSRIFFFFKISNKFQTKFPRKCVSHKLIKRTSLLRCHSLQCFLPFSWISRMVRFHHLLQVYTSFKQIKFSASFFLSFHVFSFFSLKFQTNFRQSFQMCVS